jgi:hypothetical protein
MVKKSKGCSGGIMGLVGVAGTRVLPAPTLDPPLARSYYKTYKQRHETVMTRLKMTRKKSHFWYDLLWMVATTPSKVCGMWA